MKEHNEEETEERIFTAAQKIFQEKGYAAARMQEIADEAGINKSMLHYYHRSKDKLFLVVFRASVRKILPQVFGILSSEMDLEEKVRQIVDFYYRAFRENPFLPSFVTYEMNQNPERFKTFVQSFNIQLPHKFVSQVKEEIADGKMMPIDPRQFLLNVVGLCLMPMVARNMVQTLFRLTDEAFYEFLDERKELIPKIVFSGVSP